MINSEGGSVLYGMSMFSVIQSCPIEVDCIIEGIAASMGSVIWAAGANLYMHDYSLLMIHNPFHNRSGENDANTQQTVNAFRSQLETIYRKRFGMTKEQVQSIMDGEEGVDGTFFTAQDAVKAGFIQADHILKTSKLVRDKVKIKLTEWKMPLHCETSCHQSMPKSMKINFLKKWWLFVIEKIIHQLKS